MLSTVTEKDLLKYLKEEHRLPVEVPRRNYWFLRTNGGDFFKDFCKNNYVAIGWDDIQPIAEKDRTEEILKGYKLIYGRMTTRIMNQVYRFCYEMKKGDIVIIPAARSNKFAFGVLTEDSWYEETLTNEVLEDKCACHFKKRRSVKWIQSAAKHMVDSKLYLFFRNQQALSNANDYTEFIERAINPYYILAGVAHITFSVQRKSNIPAPYLPLFITGLLEYASTLSNSIASRQSETEDAFSNKISARINVQSPGVIEFLGDPVSILCLAIVGFLIVGGKAHFSYTSSEGINADLSTDGVLGFILKLLKQKKDSHVSVEALQEITNDLNIKPPKDD